MRQPYDYNRCVVAVREHIKAGRLLETNDELEHIDPPKMRATIPVFLLREEIYRAMDKADLRRTMLRILAECREYAEREGIEWPLG